MYRLSKNHIILKLLIHGHRQNSAGDNWGSDNIDCSLKEVTAHWKTGPDNIHRCLTQVHDDARLNTILIGEIKCRESHLE